MESALTKQQFLKYFPLPKSFEDEGIYIDRFWTYEYNAPPEAFFPYIQDSSRLNRNLGHLPVDYEEINGELFGSQGEGKFREKFKETRWEWRRPYWASRLREFLPEAPFQKLGLITIYFQGVDAHRTRAYVFLAHLIKSKLGEKVINAYLEPFEAKYKEVLGIVANRSKESAPLSLVLPEEKPEFSDQAVEIFETTRKHLLHKGFDSDEVNIFLDTLKNSEISELVRIRPIRFAKRSHISLSKSLAMFLHSVRSGLLSLSWDLVCPHCQGSREEVSSLADVQLKVRCEVCRIDFHSDKKDTVEITFRLHPSVAKLKRILYCSAEAGKRQNALARFYLNPGRNEIPVTTLPPGALLLCRGKEQPLQYTAQINTHQSEKGDLPEYSQTLVVDLEDKEECPATLEIPHGEDEALHPSMLFGFQEFRDLFHEEYLSSDLRMDLGNQVLVFTDLVGSTKMYDQSGDAAAFKEVKKHFELLYSLVKENDGAIIKTMGDGSLICFPTTQCAWNFSKKLLNDFEDQNSQIKIKLGAHQGPCLAVTLTSGVDFFGRTVNRAAKLLLGAGPNELVCSQEFLQSLGNVDTEKTGWKRVRIESNSLIEPISAWKWKQNVSNSLAV
ncbi:adenylate/guanylate cyclase domain-containing protein [Leptospira perolatii]|nr:adenylate/guanylate cyclase domain-containing protein [Leptospira perolatii]